MLQIKFYQKAYLSIALFLFQLSFSNAQQDFKGKVIDAKTKEPIPYVNIGIIDAGIGTVSDEKGLFHLPIDIKQFSKDSQILFSALGYETFYTPVSDIEKVYNEYTEIPLQPSVLELNEVVVSNKGKRFIQDDIGYRNYGEKSFGYWKDNIALGGELATNIIVKKGLRKLKKFEFEIWSNPSDSLLLRVNFYKVDGELGKPKTNLNTSKKNIYKTIYSTDIVVTVDLEPYEIYVKDNFIASLELLEIYGEQDLGLVLAASLPHHKVAKSPPIIGGTSLRTNGKGSYRRYASQDNWKLISDVNMAYHIESDLMVSEKVAQRYERKMAKRKKNRQKVSGFAILNGKMISDVTVLNSRTKETTKTNENGKYIIEAKEKDILMFSKKGFHVVSNKVRDKPTLNALMKPLRK